MTDYSMETKQPRSIWLRGLMMLLMALCYQLVSTVLAMLALLQFVLVLVSDSANLRLSAFGCSLGRYQAQIADFVSFASEDAPFPFADWPDRD